MSQLTARSVPVPSTDQPTVQGTDVMAILGFVFAFVVPPLGIAFSALGLRRTRRSGTGGRWLAVAGMVLSLLLTAGFLLLLTVSATAG